MPSSAHVVFLPGSALRLLAGLLLALLMSASCGLIFAQGASGIRVEQGRGGIAAGRVLVDTTGALSVEQVHAKFLAGEGQQIDAGEVVPTGRGRAVWYRVPFPAVATPTQFLLSVPYPNMDNVDFYQLTAPAAAAEARWQEQRAGDMVPVASWPVRHLFPSFDVLAQPGENRPSYLRVAHSYPVSVNWTLEPMNSFREQNQQWYLFLGVYVGIVLLIVLMSALQALTWRDAAQFCFAAYVLVFSLAHLSLTGLAGEYLWPQNAWWNDRAPLALSLLAAAALHLFLGLLVVDRDVPWRSYWMFAMALLGGAIATGFVAWGRGSISAVMVPYYVASVTTYLGVAGWYALRRPRFGLWVLAAMVFAVGGSVFSLLRITGLLSFDVPIQYGAQVAAALEILLLLMAMHIRNRELYTSRERVGSLAKVDPLTGVANHRVLVQRVRRLIIRQQRDPGTGAVIRIRLGNAAAIQQEYGAEAAQNAMVHAGACIIGVSNEGDTVARHRDGDFVLILQGHLTREQLAAIGQRLIARGLAHSPGMPSSMTLQLKLAVAEAPFKAPDANALLQSMESVLEELASRAGTALRFVVRPA